MTRGGLGVGGSMLIVFLVSAPRAISQTTVTVPVCAADVVDVVALEAFTRLEAGRDVRFTFDESMCRGARVRVQIRDSRGRARFVTLTLPPGTRRARTRALALSLAESTRGIQMRARRDVAPASRRIEASTSEAVPARSPTSFESSAEIRAESRTENPAESSAESRTETPAESVAESSAETRDSRAATEPSADATESNAEASPPSASGSSAAPSSDFVESIGSASPASAPSAVASLDTGQASPEPASPVDHPTPHGHARERDGVSRRFGLDAFVRGTRGPSLLFGAGVELRWRRRALVLVPHVATSFGSARRDVRARALLSEIGLSVGAAWTPGGVELDLRLGPRVGVINTWSTARGDVRVVPWLHLESDLRLAFGSFVLRIALGAIVLGARVYTPNTIAFDLRGLTFGVGIGLRMPR